MRTGRRVASPLLLLLLLGVALAGDDKGKGGKPAKGDDPAAKPKEAPDPDIQDLRAGGDEKKRYLVHGPKAADAKEVKGGRPVLYVLPGGTGDDGFKGFVKAIRNMALTDDWLAVQLVSVKWRDDQTTVWPLEKLPARDQKFTTEEFFDAVHKDVTKAYKVDPKRVFMLGWSSGGPPTWSICFQPKTPVVGAYVAMSVFRPNWMPKVEGAKGRPFFIYHSPKDETCEFAMAEKARDVLKKDGAVVELVTYEGGHGWPEGAERWAGLKKGMEFLAKNAPK